MAAASVALPMALVSIAKLFLFVGGAAILLSQKPVADPEHAHRNVQSTAFAVLLVLAAFTISLGWTSASESSAFGSLAKYGKLLTIPLIALLIQSRREATIALAAFAAAQIFTLLSTWMLVAHLPVPWATSNIALTEYAVFSRYLDQSIMSGVFAAICWHLRSLVPGKYGKQAAVTASAVSLVTVFFIFAGRTGYLVAVVVISLAVMWALPKRARIGVLLLPFVLLVAAALISPSSKTRLLQVKQEVQVFNSAKGESVVTGSSSGIRLHFWNRSIQSISEHPLKGSGIGSWSNEFNRLESEDPGGHQKIAELGNPHQEYLLWGVQLGLPGVLLFMALLSAIFRDTWRLDKAVARSAQSVLAALAVSCLFNSTLYDALIGDFFCVVLGLLLALGSYKAPPPTGRSKHER